MESSENTQNIKEEEIKKNKPIHIISENDIKLIGDVSKKVNLMKLICPQCHSFINLARMTYDEYVTKISFKCPNNHVYDDLPIIEYFQQIFEISPTIKENYNCADDTGTCVGYCPICEKQLCFKCFKIHENTHEKLLLNKKVKNTSYFRENSMELLDAFRDYFILCGADEKKLTQIYYNIKVALLLQMMVYTDTDQFLEELAAEINKYEHNYVRYQNIQIFGEIEKQNGKVFEFDFYSNLMEFLIYLLGKNSELDNKFTPINYTPSDYKCLTNKRKENWVFNKIKCSYYLHVKDFNSNHILIHRDKLLLGQGSQRNDKTFIYIYSVPNNFEYLYKIELHYIGNAMRLCTYGPSMFIISSESEMRIYNVNSYQLVTYYPNETGVALAELKNNFILKKNDKNNLMICDMLNERIIRNFDYQQFAYDGNDLLALFDSRKYGMKKRCELILWNLPLKRRLLSKNFGDSMGDIRKVDFIKGNKIVVILENQERTFILNTNTFDIIGEYEFRPLSLVTYPETLLFFCEDKCISKIKQTNYEIDEELKISFSLNDALIINNKYYITISKVSGNERIILIWEYL